MDLKDKIRNVFWGRNIASASLFIAASEKSWDEIADCLVDVCQAEIHDAVAWYAQEFAMMHNENQELRTELMLAQSSFGVHDRTQATYNPKRRSNFEK